VTRPAAVEVAPGVAVGGGSLAFIAGPCTLESEAMAVEVATALASAARALGVALVFKGSFDKANRTASTSPRGPGLAGGLRILADVRRTTGLPVLTDVHEAWQAERAAGVCDVLQVPAFLCRQTDLVEACGATGRVVNIKKGPFAAPLDLAHAVEKARRAGGERVLLTERGTTFGYGDLVVDFRSLPLLASLGCPVVYDATHSVQRPAAAGSSSGGDRRFLVPLLAAAIGAGVDAVFLEVHPDPPRAASDRETQVPLARVAEVLAYAVRLHAAARACAPPPAFEGA